MAVDQLQQSSAPRPAEPAGKFNEPGGPGSNAEGRRKTLLFAAIIGCRDCRGRGRLLAVFPRTYESTDDAQVDGHLNGITARIDGDVKAVYVEENQSVQGGTTCSWSSIRAIIEVALEQAQAQLLKAQADERAENPNLPDHAEHFADQRFDEPVRSRERRSRASQPPSGTSWPRSLTLQEVEANNAKAQADVARYKALVDKNEVSRSQYDQVVATAKALAASVDSARASAESAQKVVDQRKAQLEQARSHDAVWPA